MLSPCSSREGLEIICKITIIKIGPSPRASCCWVQDGRHRQGHAGRGGLPQDQGTGQGGQCFSY